MSNKRKNEYKEVTLSTEGRYNICLKYRINIILCIVMNAKLHRIHCSLVQPTHKNEMIIANLNTYNGMEQNRLGSFWVEARQ